MERSSRVASLSPLGFGYLSLVSLLFIAIVMMYAYGFALGIHSVRYCIGFVCCYPMYMSGAIAALVFAYFAIAVGYVFKLLRAVKVPAVDYGMLCLKLWLYVEAVAVAVFSAYVFNVIAGFWRVEGLAIFDAVISVFKFSAMLCGALSLVEGCLLCLVGRRLSYDVFFGGAFMLLAGVLWLLPVPLQLTLPLGLIVFVIANVVTAAALFMLSGRGFAELFRSYRAHMIATFMAIAAILFISLAIVPALSQVIDASIKLHAVKIAEETSCYIKADKIVIEVNAESIELKKHRQITENTCYVYIAHNATIHITVSSLFWKSHIEVPVDNVTLKVCCGKVTKATPNKLIVESSNASLVKNRVRDKECIVIQC